MDATGHPLLGASAALLDPALRAFVDGADPAAVHAEAARLLRDIAAADERVLAHGATHEALARLAAAEGLARTALRLADLAALRPRGQVVAPLRSALLAMRDTVAPLWQAVAAGAPLDGLSARLDQAGQARRELLRLCVQCAGEDPRLVTACLAVTAAAQRLDESAEHAVAALRPAVAALA